MKTLYIEFSDGFLDRISVNERPHGDSFIVDVRDDCDNIIIWHDNNKITRVVDGREYKEEDSAYNTHVYFINKLQDGDVFDYD